MSNNKSGPENIGKQATTNKEKVLPIISSSSSNETNDINALRSDVDDLSSEVKTAVIDLKKSISDIRSSVSEIENPFNILREVSNEKEIENLTGKLPLGAKSLILGKEQENNEEQKETNADLENIDQTEPVIEKPKKMLIPLPQKSTKPSSAYLDWIWNLLDAGLTAENIRQLACTCELMNYLPPQTNVLIYSLAVTAERIRALGFSKGHLLLFIYKAAAISKTTMDPEDMEALIDITEQQLINTKNNRGTT